MNIVEALARNGANINIQNDLGQSVLHVAVNMGKKTDEWL